MHRLALALWCLGFWPVIISLQYVLMRAGFGSDGLLRFICTATWILGMILLWRLIRDDTKEEDREVEPNTLVIVEAPTQELADAVGATYLETDVYFDKALLKLRRRVLNGEYDDDSDILGTISRVIGRDDKFGGVHPAVDDVAEGVHPFSELATYHVWITLDKPDDYKKLSERIGWRKGEGEKRRSTSPPITVSIRRFPLKLVEK